MLIDQNIVEQLVEDVSLVVVENTSISMKQIILEDGPYAHRMFAAYLVQVFYNNTVDRIRSAYPDAPFPVHMRERTLTMAKVTAHQWLLDRAHDLVDQSTAYLLEEATRTGWFRENDYFSWDNLKEMVAATLEKQAPGGGGYWQWLTIFEEILPAAEQSGISLETFYASQTQIRKMRQLPPAYNNLKNQMEMGVITEEQGKEKLAWMLDLAADPAVDSGELQVKLDDWRGIVRKPTALQGYAVVLPENGKMLYIIETDSRAQAAFIETANRNKVEFQVVGIKWLLEHYKDWILPKED